MNDTCDGYLSPEGECLTPTLPIGTLAPIPPTEAPTIHELPNTGPDLILPLLLAAAFALAGLTLRITGRRTS